MNVRMMIPGCGAMLALAFLLPAQPAWAQRADPKSAELEKRLDRLLQEVEELRRELRGDKGGAKAAELDKARAEVKRQAGEVEKLQTQLREAASRLQKAQQQLDELEGRRGRGPGGLGGFGPGGFGPGGQWDWRNWQQRMDRPGERPQLPRGGEDLERSLEKLRQDMEELRRQLKR